jgi:hypothetical protein
VATYLSGFLRNLPAIQTRQLFRILSKKRDLGELRTYQEFQDELDNLSKIFHKDNLKNQLPQLAFADGDLLESNAVSTFMEYLLLDMEALLGEAEHISNASRAHHRILVENYFNAIEAAIVELEKKVRAYEVLTANKYTGFDDIKVLDFTNSISVAGLTPKSFVDERGKENLAWSPARLGEEGLKLAINPEVVLENYYFTHIELLTDSETVNSHPRYQDLTPIDGNVPANAIDGDSRTSWQHTVLVSDPPDEATIKIKLSFEGAQRTNAISIDPIASPEMKLSNIHYINNSNQIIDLQITERYLSSSGENVVELGNIIAKAIILTLKQSSGANLDLIQVNESGSWLNRENPVASPRTSGNFDEAISRTVTRHKMNETNSVLTDSDFENFTDTSRATFSGLQFSFGLKNVFCIAREYLSTGFFLPQAYRTPTLNTIALKADLTQPAGYSTDIEFTLRKENYDTYDDLIDTEVFPVLPFGTSTVRERVFLALQEDGSEILNAGELRFYPDFGESFTIYKDEVALTLGVDYKLSVDNGTTWESVSPTATPGVPQKCLVMITSPRGESIYLAAYTPLLSSREEGGEIFLNADRTSWLDRHQTYVFRTYRSIRPIKFSRLYLEIILRLNSFDPRVTPVLKEVLLLLGHHG